MLQQFLRDAEGRTATASVRSDSQWVCCVKGSLGFQMSVHEHGLVESWLSAKLSGPATGDGRALEAL